LLTFNHRVTHEFGKLIKARMDHITESLIDGSSLPEMQIRRLQGEAAGLRLAEDLLADAIAICEGE